MKKKLINYLSSYSKNPKKIDQFLVSIYLKINNLEVKKNILLKDQLLEIGDPQYTKVNEFSELIESMALEELFEIFEFVLSPEEKIVTGAVYTPENIREFIVGQTFTYKPNIFLADISCGCGGFLVTAAKAIKSNSNDTYSTIIERNIWGLDIAEYSIKRTKIILSLLALENGEDDNIKFNLFVGNALDFVWSENSDIIKKNNGFDLIIGNPPYVCSRNIDEKNKALLEKWKVTKSGHPDLYIPFFQIALENINQGGTLGYITVNTFFKSVNGRSLREYFSANSFSFKIVDFKDEQVFKKRNTYTCICIIEKKISPYIEYTALPSSSLKKLSEIPFTKNEYASFDNITGWNLVDKASLKSVLRKIEGLDSKLFSRFSFSTGIATLKNDIYVFKSARQDRQFYFLNDGEFEYPIEKGICRDIINSNKVTTEIEIKNITKKVIYPYSWDKNEKKYKLIDESEFRVSYPYAYSYLLSKKTILSKRDKGLRKYDSWFAFGRTQGLNVKGFKLFLPHITKKPKFVFSADEKLLFCNGEAILSNSESELKTLKVILESDIFWFYIKKTSKPYASGYLSLGKNYLKQFSIPHFTDAEKGILLSTWDRNTILQLLLRKYGLTKRDISLK